MKHLRHAAHAETGGLQVQVVGPFGSGAGPRKRAHALALRAPKNAITSRASDSAKVSAVSSPPISSTQASTTVTLFDSGSGATSVVMQEVSGRLAYGHVEP